MSIADKHSAGETMAALFAGLSKSVNQVETVDDAHGCFQKETGTGLNAQEAAISEEPIQLNPEQEALFNSPMAQQGLHPAYLLGLQPPPPILSRTWETNHSAQSQEQLHAVNDVARQLLGPLLPPSLAYNSELYPRLLPSKSPYFDPTKQPTTNCGSELAINPHRRPPSVDDVMRWPYAPQHTVPGFVFEGAEFYEEPSSSVPSSLQCKKKFHNPLLRSLSQLVANTFSTCWVW